jgi:hypothetical protein
VIVPFQGELGPFAPEQDMAQSLGHVWGLRPTPWFVLSSVADLLIISVLTIRGIAMAPLPISLLASEFA